MTDSSPSDGMNAPKPRRSPAVFLLNAYLGITVFGVALVLIALSDEAISLIFVLIGLALLIMGVIGLLTNLRVSNGELILRRRLTLAWRGLPLSDIAYARIDQPWTDWGAPGGLSGVTLVLKSGEAIPVLESGTYNREHAERWLAYLDDQLHS